MRNPVVRAVFDRRKLVVDLFAGGGGTSEGIYDALGFEPDIAANHDPEAVAMHAVNHPRTKHYIEDVRKLKIREVCAGRQVGLLWLSPDCKHHSIAKGGKPVDRKIRGLAWEAVRWADEARPDVIILENVKEFRGWGPVRRVDNLPCKLRKGLTYRRFKRELEKRGYTVEDRNLRACDYGAPTSRERLFLVARCDGLPIVWPEATHSEGGKGGLNPWRTAAQCIDFALPTPSIFLTKKQGRALGVNRPLAKNTMARVGRGVFRYVIAAAEPFIVPIEHYNGRHMADSIRCPVRTLVASSTGPTLALVAPSMVQLGYGEREGQAPRALDIRQPIGTLVGTKKHGVVAAFLAQHNGGFYDRRGGAGRKVGVPMSTITAAGSNQQLVATSIMKLKGTSRDGCAASSPLPTIQAGGLHYAEVRAFLMKYHSTGGQWGRVDAPSPTVVANDSIALVTVRGERWVIADIGMRMFTPRELFRCQGFSDTYIINPVCERTIRGKKVMGMLPGDAQVRMVGNSVPPQFARALVEAQFAVVEERAAA